MRVPVPRSPVRSAPAWILGAGGLLAAVPAVVRVYLKVDAYPAARGEG